MGKRRCDQHKGTWKQGWGVLEELRGPDTALGRQQHPYTSRRGKVQSLVALPARPCPQVWGTAR